MSAPAGPPGHTDAEVSGPPGRRGRSTARITLLAVALVALLVGAGLALWHATDASTPAAAAAGRHRPSPAAPAEPGTVIVSTRSIHLGRAGVQAGFDLGNTGHLPLQYQVSSRTRWLRLTTIGGSLDSTGSARVTVLADRTLVRPGRSVGTVLVSWDGGSLRIAVSLEQPAR